MCTREQSQEGLLGTVRISCIVDLEPCLIIASLLGGFRRWRVDWLITRVSRVRREISSPVSPPSPLYPRRSFHKHPQSLTWRHTATRVRDVEDQSGDSNQSNASRTPRGEPIEGHDDYSIKNPLVISPPKFLTDPRGRRSEWPPASCVHPILT